VLRIDRRVARSVRAYVVCECASVSAWCSFDSLYREFAQRRQHTIVVSRVCWCGSGFVRVRGVVW